MGEILKTIGVVGVFFSIIPLGYVVGTMYNLRREIAEHEAQYNKKMVAQINPKWAYDNLTIAMWLLAGVATVTLIYCIGICLENKNGVAAAKEIVSVAMIYSGIILISLLCEISNEKSHYEKHSEMYYESPLGALIKKILLCLLIFVLSVTCYFLVGRGGLTRNVYLSEGEEMWAGVEHHVLNQSSKTYHLPTCNIVRGISPKNRVRSIAGIEHIEDMGYSPCGKCCP